MVYMNLKVTALAVFLLMPLLDGCVANQMVTAKEQLTPSQRLSAQAWLTTAAKDQNAQNVALTDARAKNFVGYAYFKNDGTFKMYNLDDTPKMQGTWSVSEDGKTRTITAMNAEGKVFFTRVVDIVTLNAKEFTYRVKAQDGTFVDIVHLPTQHLQPK